MQFKYTARENQPIKPRPVQSGAGAVLGKIDPNDMLCIRVDSREQLPVDFNSDYVKVTRGCIPCFDYALEGDQDNFALERKSLQDFIQSVCLHKNWIRELHKIEKAKTWGLPIVYILEFSRHDIMQFDYSIFSSGAITSQFVRRRVAQMTHDYNVHMEFCEDREGAAYEICLQLKRRKESLKINLNRQAE
jgi:ERCC4-type nuclease